MDAKYIALSNYMGDTIAICEILKEIIDIILNGTVQSKRLPKYANYSKTFNAVLPQTIVHEDNESCLKFANTPKMSPQTKHIDIPYHFFKLSL